ncbi:MAG: endonuclease III [Proteobacteria bacterium]|nr:endonuclease III [Pseudomonadota bacterium]
MNNYLQLLKSFKDKMPLSSLSMEDRGFSNNDEANTFIKEDPFAFICGLIFDQSIKSNLAWQAPLGLKKRLGTLKPADIVNLGEYAVKGAIAKKPALHRYPSNMANNIVKASQLILSNYEGDASRIWSNANSPKDLKRNLLKVGGVGEKKANLGVVMLCHNYDLSFKSLDDIGLAFDVHLFRVLSRSGFFSTKKDDLVQVNKAFQDFFGDDYSSVGTHIWVIGRKFCHEKNPECLLCPLNGACKKTTS